MNIEFIRDAGYNTSYGEAMLLMLKPTFSHSSSKKYSEFGEMNFLLD
jgi:hypothetical protein